MKGPERRKEIISILRASETEISGGELAKRLGVSRQLIVQDMALLKSDLAIFNYYGTELDSGTVVEYMFAKFDNCA